MSTAEETAGAEAQPWGEVTPDAARRLLLAAVEAFAERGYHATTTRDIAGRAGMSPAALLLHYKTKEELLHRISRIGHEKALDILRTAARAEGKPDPAPRRGRELLRPLARRRAHHRTGRAVRTRLARPRCRAEIIALRRLVRRRGARDHRGRGALGRVRRPRRAGDHPRRALPLHRRGALVQRQRLPHPRGGRRPSTPTSSSAWSAPSARTPPRAE
ncbi:hypothetical protein SHIRM173S_10301 [Streptomyces hirsutus]